MYHFREVTKMIERLLDVVLLTQVVGKFVDVESENLRLFPCLAASLIDTSALLVVFVAELVLEVENVF